MNTNIENVQEDISVGIDAITVEIPLRVEMTSVNNAPFDFTTSIDELGQIVLTPATKDVEFVSVITEAATDPDIIIMEQETVRTETEDVTTLATSIMIKGNMLAETENHTVDVAIDEIGQVIIHPVSTENTFVSAAIEDSLNLVTEDIQVIEYCGYRLMNNGDGWNVRDSAGELIEEGVATLEEAKILICKTEIARLEGTLTEEVTTEEPVTEEETMIPTDVEAEVIEEAVTPVEEEPSELTKEDILAILDNLTDSFTETHGAVRCDKESEKLACLDILEAHYEQVEVTADIDSDSFIIKYNEVKQLKEEMDATKLDIINRFMQGDIAIFSDDNSTPHEDYIHIEELDANGYAYYYDKESDSIVSYPVND